MRLQSWGLARRGAAAAGVGARETEREKTEAETKSLRRRINFNWITVNIVSARVEASHSFSAAARAPRRDATRRVTTLSSSRRTAGE